MQGVTTGLERRELTTRNGSTDSMEKKSIIQTLCAERYENNDSLYMNK